MSAAPLFLLSLPRSGSTLVQRVLGAHPGVATVSEPWVLLPVLYARRREGARAEYWHATMSEAVSDFVARLPAGERDFDAAVREYARVLYERVADEDARWFLDKTPRYHLVASDLVRVFPDARFIFLWRNPLAVVASMMETFRAGRWEPAHFAVDLERGPANLVEAARAAGPRGISVRYEDLAGGGEHAWRELFEAIDLEWDPGVLADFSEVRLEGRYGDPTGIRHDAIDPASLERWRASFRGAVRIGWARRYLRRLGESRLAAMGYDLGALETQLDAQPSAGGRALAADLAHLGAAAAEMRLRARALRVHEAALPVGDRYGRPATLRARIAAAVRAVLR